MERTELLKNLERARQHAAQGEEHIESQRQIIARLAAIGAETTGAEQILETFEQTQLIHIMDIQRLSNALSNLSSESNWPTSPGQTTGAGPATLLRRSSHIE